MFAENAVLPLQIAEVIWSMQLSWLQSDYKVIARLVGWSRV